MMRFQDYSFTYATGGSCTPALNRVCLTVPQDGLLVICGKSGSGKSTLLRCMKAEIRPAGQAEGLMETDWAPEDMAIVFQDPDMQLVNHTVLNDLVFHMENLGFPQETMVKNLAETVGFFGLEPLLHKPTHTLSGGQRQLVALCAALMTKPKLLLMDEPTAQLDPIATREFWDLVGRIQEELHVAMVITEHRLDHVAALATHVALMENGAVRYARSTREALAAIYQANDAQAVAFIPDIPRLSLGISMDMCFTAKAFKQGVPEPKKKPAETNTPLPVVKATEKPVLAMENVFFAYDGSSDFVIKNGYFQLMKEEKVCVFGGNGAGKSTFLKLLCGILKPLSGRVKKAKEEGAVAYMPQNIKSFFRYDSVEKELLFSTKGNIDKAIIDMFEVGHLMERHPLDLSGGEAQKVALACLLSQRPAVLVMDEPTKGLDPYAKAELARILTKLATTMVLATHDMAFAAHFASRCALLFDGNMALSAPPRSFFANNQYYTTPVHLGVRHIAPEVITYEEAVALWQT